MPQDEDLRRLTLTVEQLTSHLREQSDQLRQIEGHLTHLEQEIKDSLTSFLAQEITNQLAATLPQASGLFDEEADEDDPITAQQLDEAMGHLRQLLQGLITEQVQTALRRSVFPSLF